MSTNIEYKTFPQFYDAIMGDMSSKVGFFQSIIEKHSPEAKSVLEIACGTGTLIEGLSKRYTVAGLDLSPEMITVAKEKLPESDIRVADMTDFDFSKKFDVVMCVFDSINHLPELPMWSATFEKAATHLNDKGLFIFDFNTETILKTKTGEPTWVKEFEGNLMLMKVFEEGNMYRWNVRIFENIGNQTYKLREDNIHEVAFAINEIEQELKKHFEVLEVVNKKGERPKDETERPFYVCRKKV